MLPNPAQTWLTDDQGHRYEFRLVSVTDRTRGTATPRLARDGGAGPPLPPGQGRTGPVPSPGTRPQSRAAPSGRAPAVARPDDTGMQ